MAIWLIGPPGSGKSTLCARGLPAEFRRIDQDAELEQALVEHGVPLDTRLHDARQAERFAALRRQTADRLWSQLPQWRAAGMPLAYETTGDKPHLLRGEVEADRAAGYNALGLALPVPLSLCLLRNSLRARVLPEPVIERAWHKFQANLSAGVYAEIFGPGKFAIVPDAESFDFGLWLTNACRV